MDGAGRHARRPRRTRSFFNEFVTGRGPLPAVRVGNQPYGVLLTSDLSRWKYPRAAGRVHDRAVDDLTPFSRLHRLLSQLPKRWDEMAASAAYVGKPGSDPQDVLMNVLGLHPTSVEFYQRIGYSDEYLRNLDAFKDRGRYAGELASPDAERAPDGAALSRQPRLYASTPTCRECAPCTCCGSTT